MPDYIYDDGSGINIGSKLKNTSSLYPIVALERNHASGLGYFTSVGNPNGSDTDTNTSYTDAKTYLRNLPIAKRTLNYVAVLNKVEAVEATGGFASSNDPAVYVYKGGYTDSENGKIEDTDWHTASNWVQVGSSSSAGTVSVSVDGTSLNSAVGTLDLDPTAFQTSVGGSFTDPTATISFGLANDVVLNAGQSSSFRLGALGSDFINSGTGAASGIEALHTGDFKVRKDSANTTIAGGVLTADTSVTTDAVVAGSSVTVGASGAQTVISAGTTTGIVADMSSSVKTPILEGNGTLGLKLQDSSTNHIKLDFGFQAEPASLTQNSSGTNASILTNADLYIANLDEVGVQNASFVLGQDTSGKTVKLPFALVQGTGGTNIDGGFGISISGTDPAIVSVDQGVIMTLNTDQTSVAIKRMGNIVLTGDAGPNESGNFKGLTFEDGAIENFVGAGPTHTLQNMQTLLRFDSPGNADHGRVYLGSNLLSLFFQNILAGDDITSVLSNNDMTLNVDPVFLRTDRDDKSVNNVRSHRLGAHLYTQGEYEADQLINAPDANSGFLSSFSAGKAQDSTIIEWVREGGTFVGDTQADYQLRRNVGTMMKAGFTAVNSPNGASGLQATRFRFSAKTANTTEITSQQEELGGTITLGNLNAAAYQYDSTNSDFAIQIGTGNTSDPTNRYNEVFIPNLVAGTLTTNGPNYLSGGGVFQGDWNFTGDVTIGGDLTVDGANVSGASLDLAGTLVNLGIPTGSFGGNDNDQRDIGFAGIFSFNDADTDDVVDPTESFKTGFFRDASATVLNKVFFGNPGNTGSAQNTHKPYRLTITTETQPVFTSQLMGDVPEKTFSTAIEVGGLALQGYNTGESDMNAHTLNGAQGFVNRITTNISAAYTYESNAANTGNDPWNAWDHTSLPTTRAVYDFVTAQVTAGTGLSVTQATSFDYGISTGEIANAAAGATYTEASAHEIVTTADDGSTFNRISPEDLGLAIGFDADTAGRPTIGYMPGSTVLNQGTSLRAIMEKILTDFAAPTITMDSGARLVDFADGIHRYANGNTLYIENGYNEYGQDADGATSTIGVLVTNFANASAYNASTSLTSVSLTDSGSNDIPAQSAVALEGTDPSMEVSETLSGTGNVDKTHNLNFDTDTDNTDFNGIGDADVLVQLDSGKAEGTIKYNAAITAFTQNDYFAGASNISSTRTHNVRRRSFYFVSDFNVRATVAADATFDLNDGITGNFARIDGDLQTTATTTGHSNKFMHYLICQAGSGGATPLGNADKIDNTAGTPLSFTNILGSNASGQNDTTANSNIMMRHMTNGAEGTPNNANFIPFTGSGTGMQSSFKGMLAAKSVCVGTADQGVNQQWKRNTLSTSSNGFLYRCLPIEFAGTGLTSDWYSAGHLWETIVLGGSLFELVLNNAGNAPATFEFTNYYGETGNYVIFQSQQVLDQSPSSGLFPAIVQVP